MVHFTFTPSSLLLLVISLNALSSVSTGKKSSLLPLAHASPVSTTLNYPAVLRKSTEKNNRSSVTHHAPPAALARAKRGEGDPVSPSTPLVLTLQLHPRSNMEALHSKRSLEAPDLVPKSLSEDELREHVKPSNEALDDMLRWLRANGIVTDSLTTSKLGDKVNVPTTVDVAERMLDTTVSDWHVDGKLRLRSTRYTIPAAVRHVVRSIAPLLDFAPGPARRPSAASFSDAEKRSDDGLCQDASDPDPPDDGDEGSCSDAPDSDSSTVMATSTVSSATASSTTATSQPSATEPASTAAPVVPPPFVAGNGSYSSDCPLSGYQSPACIR